MENLHFTYRARLMTFHICNIVLKHTYHAVFIFIIHEAVPCNVTKCGRNLIFMRELRDVKPTEGLTPPYSARQDAPGNVFLL